jgi:hypothetical protein
MAVNKRKIQYLCRTEQQVRAKAYAGVPDKDKVPHPGAPCLTEQASMGSASPEGHCLQKQYNGYRCVYAGRMTSEEVTTVSVYK